MDDEIDLTSGVEAAKLAYEASLCVGKDEPLEIRRRTFEDGSKHFVWQCLRCGEHRGNPLGAAAAREKLGGRQPADFDAGLEEFCRKEQSRLLSAWTSQIGQKFESEQPEIAAYLAANRAENQARLARIDTLVNECAKRVAEESNDAAAADALSNKAVAIRKERRRLALEDTALFADEDALKVWLTENLSEDFMLLPEVLGRHIATGVRVKIDFLAYPKPHLVAEGFLDGYFGIEVKHLNTEKGFSEKAGKAFWQTVSYTDSEFFVDGGCIRFKYAVLFSSMSFTKERALLKAFGHPLENDLAAWNALRQLANHANVGTLEIKGDPQAWKGWLLAFAGGRYFNRSESDEGPVYRLSNANMVTKNRIGSF